MRRAQPLTEHVRSMMAPANPLPGHAAGSGWAEPLGREIYQQIVGQPRGDSAGAVGPAPGLPAARGSGHPAAPQPVLRPALRRRLAPVAAVAAVLAMVAGLTLATRTGAGSPAPAAAAGRPPFYVTIEYHGPGEIVQVHDSGSGRTLSSVRLPSSIQPVQVAGSPSGRDFFFYVGTSLPRYRTADRVYRLRVSADGRSARLAVLSIHPGQGLSGGAFVSGLAVSPDGAWLAVTIDPTTSSPGPSGEIQIISLRDGATRTWRARGVGLSADPSWSADGRTLSFLWWDHGAGGQGGYSWDSQVRLLDTTGPDGDLLASRVIATGGGQLGLLVAAITSPDGKVIIVAAARNVPGPRHGGIIWWRLAALAPGTGRVLALYFTHQVPYRQFGLPGASWPFNSIGNCQVWGVNTTGSQSLVTCMRFGRLDNGAFTALPGPSAPTYSDAAW